MKHQDKHKLQLLNILTKHRTLSNSKDKHTNKHSLTLFTISNELNKIKHFSKRKCDNKTILKTNPNTNTNTHNNTNNNSNNILSSSLTKPSCGLFSNIPFPESSNNNNINNNKGNIPLKKNNSNISLTKPTPTLALRFNNTSLCPKKRSISQSPTHTCPNNTNNNNNNSSSSNNVIPKTSNEKNKYKTEIDKLNKLLSEKESIIKDKLQLIKKMETNMNAQKKQMMQLQSKYTQLKKNYNALSKENKMLKEQNDHALSEISFLNKKEIKLMQVIYLIKEKGINIEDILNDVSQMNGNNNDIAGSNRSEISTTSTVYFQDKVNMKSSANERSVPGLNLGVIPPYVSDSEEEDDDDDDKNNNVNNNYSQQIHSNKVNTNLNLHLISNNNMKFNKINFSNEGSDINNDNN